MSNDIKVSYVETQDVTLTQRGFMDVKISSSVSSFDKKDLNKSNNAEFNTTFNVTVKQPPKVEMIDINITKEDN